MRQASPPVAEYLEATAAGAGAAVEKLANIKFYDDATAPVRQHFVHGQTRPKRRAPGSKTVRAGEKILLVDALQNHDHRALQHLVLKGRPFHARRRANFGDRPSCAVVALGDVHAPDRWRPVAARLGAVEQRRQILIQMCCVIFRGLPVHPDRSVLARAPVCLTQPAQIDEVRQRRENALRVLLGQLCYPSAFR